MGSYSDSNSDSDDELPALDFLSQTWKRDAPDRNTKAAVTTTTIISSDSDEDRPPLSLGQRLQQRQGRVTNSSSSFTNGGQTEKKNTSAVNLLTAEEVEACRRREEEEVEGFRRREEEVEGFRRREEEVQGFRRREEEVQGFRRREEEVQGCKRRQEQVKEEQLKQKAERKALALAAKSLRPEECMKHMVVCVDPALLQLEGGGTLLAALQTLGCSCSIEKQALPRSVSWMRKTTGAEPGEEVCVPEASVAMQMTLTDFISLTHSYIQQERHGRCDAGPSLTSWIQQRQRQHPDKTLSLLVVGLDAYFKSQKSQNQKRFREAVTGEEAQGGKSKRRRKDEGEMLTAVTRIEVEEALVDLQLHTSVSVHFLSSWLHFTQHITMMTKAVAEAPFKRSRDQCGFSFLPEVEGCGGQRVQRCGGGLLQVWKRQIQQLNRVSPDMAAAILTAYPSPQLLRKAYDGCSSSEEKLQLLSDLLVRRGEGVTSTNRRVGPELSKRIYLLINSSLPQQILDTQS